MENERRSTEEQFKLMFAIQMGQIALLLDHINALESVLLEQGLLPGDLMWAALEKAQQMEQSQDLRKMIAELRGDSSLEDILKDFEGPVQ